MSGSFPSRPVPKKVYTPAQAAYYAQPAWLRLLKRKSTILTLGATTAYLGDHFLLEGSILRTARTLSTGSVKPVLLLVVLGLMLTRSPIVQAACDSRL